MTDSKTPSASDGNSGLGREQFLIEAIKRGLADMKSGATVAHETAMAEIDALIDQIDAKKFFEERAKRADP